MISSRTEKETLGLQDNNVQTRQHQFTCGRAFGHRRGSPPPFTERKEGFDDWVKELWSILQTQDNPLGLHASGKKYIWVGGALVTLIPMINPISTAVLFLGISSHLSEEEIDLFRTLAALGK